jgi:hypothetical protein
VQQHYRSKHNASTSKQCTAETDSTALLVLQVRDQGIPCSLPGKNMPCNREYSQTQTHLSTRHTAVQSSYHLQPEVDAQVLQAET